MADEKAGAGLRAWIDTGAHNHKVTGANEVTVVMSGEAHAAIYAALVRCEQLETEREGNILARDALASEANAIRGQFAASQREAALVKERDVARRYATAWKACAKSNRIGFGWWDTCTDAAWSFNGSLTGTLCERFAVRIFVEPSPHAPHGGGYFISANDRRDAILAAIDRIETDRDAALARVAAMMAAVDPDECARRIRATAMLADRLAKAEERAAAWKEYAETLEKRWAPPRRDDEMRALVASVKAAIARLVALGEIK